jgi:hypothetical protein
MIATASNPSTQANEVRRAIVRGIRDSSLTLYEGYQLHCEAIRIERIAYTQSAWGRQLSISGLLSIVMHALTAKAFGLNDAASNYERWYVDDFPLLGERRPHFLTTAYPGNSGWIADVGFLQHIHTTRVNYDKLSDDDGPYAIEVFPYDFAAPERVLLGDPVSVFEHSVHNVSDAVGDAIVNLATGRWG